MRNAIAVIVGGLVFGLVPTAARGDLVTFQKISFGSVASPNGSSGVADGRNPSGAGTYATSIDTAPYFGAYYPDAQAAGSYVLSQAGLTAVVSTSVSSAYGAAGQFAYENAFVAFTPTIDLTYAISGNYSGTSEFGPNYFDASLYDTQAGTNLLSGGQTSLSGSTFAFDTGSAGNAFGSFSGALTGQLTAGDEYQFSFTMNQGSGADTPFDFSGSGTLDFSFAPASAAAAPLPATAWAGLGLLGLVAAGRVSRRRQDAHDPTRAGK